MSTKTLGNTTVRELVRQYPAARRVLEQFGIDYCCGGAKSLAEAAKAGGADVDKVIAAVEKAIEAGANAPGETNWSQASMTELADHIEQKHHAFMKRELPRLKAMLDKLARVHVAHRTMLLELQRIVETIDQEVTQHLYKEEEILFPMIRQIDAYTARGGEKPECHCGSVANPIRQMEVEHESLGEALEQMRRLTDNYKLPADGCETFAAAYDGLQSMEEDLHEHVHLENNILFPKAVELEAAAGL